MNSRCPLDRSDGLHRVLEVGIATRGFRIVLTSWQSPFDGTLVFYVLGYFAS